MVIRLDRLVRALPLVALLALFAPTPVSADHCGGAATVSPSSGVPGTTFVFSTNLGAPGDLRLYRNGKLVKEVFLPGDGFVRYDIETESGDAGEWRAHAQVHGRPDCYSEASFTVRAPPDTSTASPGPPGLAAVLILTAGMAAIALFPRRSRA